MPKISIDAFDGGRFDAYLARPARTPAAGILVIQEIFGVNQVMRDLCDGFAAQGYIALCPDIFWRQEPGIELTDKTEANWQRAFQLYGGLDVDNGIEDLKSALEALRRLDGSTGKAGCVGYCLGGKLAYLMACRSDADASVGYYGVAIESDLGEARMIARPLLLHIAGEDEYVPKEAQAAIHQALDPNPLVTLYDYPGCNHAFARVGGQHWDAEAAAAANQRSADFFKRHLA